MDTFDERKAARAVADELERRRLAEDEARRRAGQAGNIFRFSPLASAALFASALALPLFLLLGNGAGAWISLFALVESLYVAAHNSLSWGRRRKYYALLTACAAASFAGIYALVALGRDAAGIALALAGFAGVVAVTARSSTVHGGTERFDAPMDPPPSGSRAAIVNESVAHPKETLRRSAAVPEVREIVLATGGREGRIAVDSAEAAVESGEIVLAATSGGKPVRIRAEEIARLYGADGREIADPAEFLAARLIPARAL
jgi:hypothetical protein